MKQVLGWIAAIARFSYSFVVGDDWRVAAAIVLGLAATAGLDANGVNAWWLVPPLAVVITAVSLSRRAHTKAR